MSGRWNPNLNLAGSLRRAGATTPGQAVDHLADALLAVELGPGTRAMLVSELERLRAEAAATPSDRSGRFRLRARRADEGALRSLVHLMLSLPEAQLH